jgi:hypothetical protein
VIDKNTLKNPGLIALWPPLRLSGKYANKGHALEDLNLGGQFQF